MCLQKPNPVYFWSFVGDTRLFENTLSLKTSTLNGHYAEYIFYDIGKKESQFGFRLQWNDFRYSLFESSSDHKFNLYVDI